MLTGPNDRLPDRVQSQKMNVLRNQRIGWDKKKEATDQLAALQAEGFLSEEEYQSRIEWVMKASTQEQVDYAMSDLSWGVRFRPAIVTPKPPVPKTSNKVYWFSVSMLIISAMALGNDIGTHHMLLTVVQSFVLLLWVANISIRKYLDK